MKDMEEEIKTTDEVNDQDIANFLAQIDGTKPLITEEIVNIILEENVKPGFLTLDYKIGGKKSSKTFRGSIDIWLMRSWVEKVEIKTSKWSWVPKKPGSRKLKRVPNESGDVQIDSRPGSYRVKLMSVYDENAGNFSVESWNKTIARFSAAYTLLERILEDLQKNKLQEIDGRIDEIFIPGGTSDVTEAEGFHGGSEEVAGEDGKEAAVNGSLE